MVIFSLFCGKFEIMFKRLLVIVIAVFAVSCGEKKSTKALEINGYIKGLKKGTIYIQRIKDTVLVAIDTIKINGDSHFTSELDLKEPEMLYLFLDRGVTNSLDNNIAFFAEPGKLTLETNLDYFTADVKISGSENHKLYEEYKKVVSRYVDKDLELIKKKLLTPKDKQAIHDKIEEDRKAIQRSKYLYTTNFAVNNRDHEVAPYVALAEIYDINLKFLDTIQKSLTPKIAKSRYGKQLKAYVEERRQMEAELNQ